MHANTYREAVTLALLHVLWDEDLQFQTRGVAALAVREAPGEADRAYRSLRRMTPLHRVIPA